MAGGSALKFPSTSFPSQYKNATAKSSFLFALQFPLPKLSSSASYSIRTHFPANPFGKSFHVRCLPQEDPRFKPQSNGLKQSISDPFSNTVDNKVAEAGNEETSASSIDSNSDGRVVQYNGKAIANEAFEGGTTGVNVSVVLCDGEYVLKIKRRNISSSTDNEDMAERLQSAGMLFLQAEILREMGEQLLAQYRASLRSIL